MKRENWLAFLKTIDTLVVAAGIAFLTWFLWQLLPMLVCYD